MAAELIDRKLRNADIPIRGVVQVGAPDNPDFEIDFDPAATAQERAAGQAILAAFDRRLEDHRHFKMEMLEFWWATVQTKGIQPRGHNVRLGITGSDVALLTGQFMLAKTAVELGLKTPDDTFVVAPKKGGLKQLKLAELTGMLLDYGEQRTALTTQYLTYQAAIEQAASIAELDAVSFDNEPAAGRTPTINRGGTG